MKALLVLSLVSATAYAEISPPDRAETFSRGFQQAKRLATLANQQDIPSRAYWLSTRLIRNSKNISLNEKKEKAKKPPISIKN